MISAAISSGLARTAAWICAIACCSTAIVSANTWSVMGKRSFGLMMRGQSNLGKYWYLRGSAVLVSERV